jgi:hypothetical protein
MQQMERRWRRRPGFGLRKVRVHAKVESLRACSHAEFGAVSLGVPRTSKLCSISRDRFDAPGGRQEVAARWLARTVPCGCSFVCRTMHGSRVRLGMSLSETMPRRRGRQFLYVVSVLSELTGLELRPGPGEILANVLLCYSSSWSTNRFHGPRTEAEQGGQVRPTGTSRHRSHAGPMHCL